MSESDRIALMVLSALLMTVTSSELSSVTIGVDDVNSLSPSYRTIA